MKVFKAFGRPFFWRYSRFDDLWYNLRNRLFRKYYLLDIRAMGRGDWYDCDFKIFHAVFQLLVNFVEEEKSHMTMWLSRETDETDPEVRAWLRATWFDRRWNRQAWKERLGMAYLRWEMTLDGPSIPEDEQSPGQAQSARQILALYKWYKWERPERDKTREAREFHGFERLDAAGNPTHEWRGEKDAYGTLMNTFSPEYNKYCDELHAIEAQHKQEDTEKAQLVVALRQGMWT